jgi:hypothetical protein
MAYLPAYLYLIRPSHVPPGLNVGILGHQLRFRLSGWMIEGSSHGSSD